ncbi:MAG: CopD family protein [Nitrospirae bacterium]|nr:CopD family protein [Nitrospirota bacterium]MBF0592258.1 CopD family protein [Nitrospirota bacterium]
MVLVIFLLPSPCLSMPEYANQTGKPCVACHVDPSGGARLTTGGEEFKDTLRVKGLYRPMTSAQRIIRLIVGYLHMLTAIVWFGAIFYVHILLKPVYASRGLPRGELWIGISSIIIMAVTGTFLTIARVPSLKAMYTTRFGILLSIKIALFLIMVVSAIFVIFVIGPMLRRDLKKGPGERKDTYTPEELSSFDGTEGRAAYVGYSGNVYDVSNSKLWKNGSHARKHQAGADMTELLKTAPHSDEVLKRMPIAGKLTMSATTPNMPVYMKVFYFLAYMNLAMVFLIVFVISLWRWL